MNNLYINLNLPQKWADLNDRQLAFVFCLLATNLSLAEVQTLCLLKWSKTYVIGRQENGDYMLKHGKKLFAVSPLQIAELTAVLDWVSVIPDFPVRPARMKRRKPVAPDFADIPFQYYIVTDNLYQGYLATRSDELLDQMAGVMYPGIKTPLLPWQRIAVFYWAAALKGLFSKRYPDLFQPSADNTDLLGNPAMSVEEAMNAQIRALTKGDVTKESEVLALDTHRALTELNAQAREYKQLKENYKK